jgi:hypothetical protein
LHPDHDLPRAARLGSVVTMLITLLIVLRIDPGARHELRDSLRIPAESLHGRIQEVGT